MLLLDAVVLELVGTSGAVLADVFCEEEDCDETVLLLVVDPATLWEEDEEDDEWTEDVFDEDDCVDADELGTSAALMPWVVVYVW